MVFKKDSCSTSYTSNWYLHRIWKGSKFECSNFSKLCKIQNGNVKRLRHLDLFIYRCSCSIKIPRINCNNDAVKVVGSIPWGGRGNHYSFKSKILILLLFNEMFASAISRELGEPDNNLWYVFSYWVDKRAIQEFTL